MKIFDTASAWLDDRLGPGRILQPEQPEQLAGAIRGMLGQEPGLEKMGQNGRRKLETNYTRERCIQQHEQMLLDVIKQHLRR